MNTIRTIARLGSIVCLLNAMFWISTAHAQQSNATPSAEQEFFDAIKKGDSARVAELLKQQPALIRTSNKRGITPVLYAVYAKHPEIAESFIATGIELSIFEAVATRRIGLVRELIKKDPKLIHAWSPDGWTALHLNFNNLEMAKLLIDSGADLNLNSRNKLNATPLQGAAANNWIDLAKLYLARGANVNCRLRRTPYGNAVLYIGGLGRFEGPIVAVANDYFSMKFFCSRKKREKLADMLTIELNRHLLNGVEK